MSSVYRCSLSEKTLCTSELITDCLCVGWCDSVCRYLFVLIFCTLDRMYSTKVLLAFLETRTSRKGSFSVFFYVCNEMDIWMLIVEENKEFTNLALPCLHITNVSST